jgi:hypothetical protein
VTFLSIAHYIIVTGAEVLRHMTGNLYIFKEEYNMSGVNGAWCHYTLIELEMSSLKQLWKVSNL